MGLHPAPPKKPWLLTLPPENAHFSVNTNKRSGFTHGSISCDLDLATIPTQKKKKRGSPTADASYRSIRGPRQQLGDGQVRPRHHGVDVVLRRHATTTPWGGAGRGSTPWIWRWRPKPAWDPRLVGEFTTRFGRYSSGWIGMKCWNDEMV